MAELTFKSYLSIDEVEENFKDMDFFSEIMDSLTEALADSKGQAVADTFTRKRSLPVIDVYGTRKSLNMTQKGFADMLGVSRRTVEAWESGRTSPTPTAKKLIYLISEDKNLAKKLMEA